MIIWTKYGISGIYNLDMLPLNHMQCWTLYYPTARALVSGQRLHKLAHTLYSLTGMYM